MEQYYSKNSLRELNQKILIGDYTEPYLNDYFMNLFDVPNFDKDELNSLVLIACSALKAINSSPLIKLLVDQVYTRMVLEILFPADKEEEQIMAIEEPVEEKIEELDEIKQIFINKYKQFKKSEHPELKYPHQGSTSIIKLKDNVTFPGQSYYMQFEIDSEGNVIEMVGEPKAPVVPKDYSAIYDGLLGQVMEYQKV